MIVTIIDVYNPGDPIVKDVEYNGELPQPYALINVRMDEIDPKTTPYLVVRHVFSTIWVEGYNALTSFVTIHVALHVPGRTPESEVGDASLCQLCGVLLTWDHASVHPECATMENAKADQ